MENIDHSTLRPLSPNGDSEIPPGAVTVAAATDPKLAFQSQMCGIGFGIGTMMGDQAQALTSKLQQTYIFCECQCSYNVFSSPATLHCGRVH